MAERAHGVNRLWIGPSSSSWCFHFWSTPAPINARTSSHTPPCFNTRSVKWKRESPDLIHSGLPRCLRLLHNSHPLCECECVSAGVTHREEGDDTSSYTRHIKPDMQPRTHARQRCRHRAQARTPCINPARQPGRSGRASETPRCEDGASAGQRRREGLRTNDRELFSHRCFVSDKWPSWKIPRERPGRRRSKAESVCVWEREGERDTTGKFAAAVPLNWKKEADWEWDSLELFYLEIILSCVRLFMFVMQEPILLPIMWG